MSESHDQKSAMHEPLAHDRAIEELLSGMPPTGAVPAAYAGLAHAFGELRSLRPSLELATEVSAVTAVPAIALAVRSATSKQARTTSRPKAVGRVIAIKSAIVGALLIGATAAAAATGSLPAPAQGFISHVLSHVGISVPSAGGSGSIPRVAVPPGTKTHSGVPSKSSTRRNNAAGRGGEGRGHRSPIASKGHPKNDVKAHPKHPVKVQHPAHPVKTKHPVHPVKTKHPAHPVKTTTPGSPREDETPGSPREDETPGSPREDETPGAPREGALKQAAFSIESSVGGLIDLLPSFRNRVGGLRSSGGREGAPHDQICAQSRLTSGRL